MACFDVAVCKIVDLEGGYVDDPEDPGGETRFGISKRRYPELDIRALTRDEAIEIYRQDFWLMHHYDELADDSLAEKVFSLAVNLGPYKANVLLQMALNYTGRQVVIDGSIGPQTLGAANRHPNPAWLLATYKLEAVKHYISLGRKRYERGWISRAIA